MTKRGVYRPRTKRRVSLAPAFQSCGTCSSGWILIKGWKITRAVRCSCWRAYQAKLQELAS